MYDAKMSAEIFPKHVELLTKLDKEIDSKIQALDVIEKTLRDQNHSSDLKIRSIENNIARLGNTDLTKYTYPDGLTILQKAEKTNNPELISGVKNLIDAHTTARSRAAASSSPELSPSTATAEATRRPASDPLNLRTPVTEARDMIFDQSQGSTKSVGADVDKITEAIRKEILQKQQKLLQSEIAESLPIGQGQKTFNDLSPQKFKEYLATEEGKKTAAEILKGAKIQQQLNKIEVEGYKKVHETFKDNFKDVVWEREPSVKVRIAEIKNDAGEKITSLKETTVDTTPTKVTLEDGTTRDIKSYRQIDFPLKLDEGKGPAHFSMAVKDENGQNISAKDAVYFTAHYDDKGKLIEISSPIPVKFMGTGDDAIGYIERNGKVYTLPVTRGNYRDMMQEVALNNDLSVAPRTVGPALQESQVLQKSGPIVNPNTLQTSKTLTIEPTTIAVTPSVGLAFETSKTKAILDTAQLTKVSTPEIGKESIVTVGVSKATAATQFASTSTSEVGKEPIVTVGVSKTVAAEQLTKVSPSEVGKEPIVTMGVSKATTATQLTKVSPSDIGVIKQQTTIVATSLAVYNKVQEIRQVLASLPRAPKVDNEKNALEMLNGKSTEQALKAISTAVGKGDEKLVKAMMSIIDKPPEGAKIPSIGKVALTKVYTDQIHSTKNMDPKERAQVQRAVGAIATKAGVNHVEQVALVGPKHRTSRERQ